VDDRFAGLQDISNRIVNEGGLGSEVLCSANSIRVHDMSCYDTMG